MSRLRWLISSALGLGFSVWAALPAEAARLLNWRFDRSQNRLEFATDGAVQPRAQLLANPTRIVIDLPGTTLGQPMVTETLGNGLQNLRVGQFDPNTTRLVLELDPGVVVNPRDIKVQGLSPSQWVVELPSLGPSSPTPLVPGLPGNVSNGVAGSIPGGIPSGGTYVEGWRETPDGLFIRTRGPEPRVEVRRSRDKRTIEIDLLNSGLNPALLNQNFSFPNLAIESLQFRPVAGNPALNRLVLTVPATAPNWRASFSNLGGLILLPSSRPTPLTGPGRSPIPLQQSQPVTPTPTRAIIQGVGLDLTGTQLLIQSDRPYNFTAKPEGQEYRVILSPAELGSNLQGPQLDPNSLLQRVRLRQDDPQTVSIFLAPAPGVQIDVPRALNAQVVSLTLRGSRSIPVPQPNNPNPNPNPPYTPPYNPDRPIGLPPSQGRPVVVLDPGHGGRDPGAVGRGGLQEKQVVFPITQEVAALLTQQGVQVVLTRYDDREVDLAPRVQTAERSNATVFVSIHANAISLDRPEVNGVETYHSGSPEGRRLAQSIHQSLLENLPTRDRQVREARFYVIRNTSMPASLVEIGFVTGAEDAPRLADPAYRSRVAQAIAQGILRYLQ